MTKMLKGNALKAFALSLLLGGFALGATGCGVGYEREELGEREEAIGEEGIGEREEVED